MLLPVEWLKEYADFKEDIKELSDRLTSSGSHVESINKINKDVKGVVVGKILKIEKHSNADKLVICKVDIGREEVQIVTGASNVNEGDYVPVAVVGSTLPGDIVIEKTDFRGEESYGMLCSLEELGYPDNVISKEMKEGILILDEAHKLGSDIVDVLGLDNNILELEITPNRPDCLSIIGMAREAVATFNIDLKEPNIKIENEVEDISEYLDDIEVLSDNCNRYYTRVVKDVKIKESPLWLQLRLMEAGIRPTNNIVDITNYVMLEYGEPLHAFDLEKLDGKKIVVRQANEGEVVKTLDNVDRKLDPEDLIIADENNPIAIAGVMGGLDSEITEDTKTVLLEGANFNKKSVRLTSKKLNLRSEASNRFEKGIDPNLCDKTVERVCQLIEEIDAGTIVKSSIDVYKDKKEEKTINLRPERVNMLLGIDLSVEEMIKYLNSLDLKSEFDGEVIITTIPTYRLDLDIEADLIEEIGRLYGFHNIESKPLVGKLSQAKKPYSMIIEDKAKFVMQGLGFNEVMTYSFISPKAYDKMNVEEDSELRNYIQLINPLGEDYSIMRTTLIPTMLELLSRNYNRNVKSTFTFEIGNSFIPKELPVRELPMEKKVLSLGFYGDEDFYYLKESVDKLLNRLGIEDVEYIREENNPIYHPGRTAKLIVEGEVLGIIGEVHPDVCENYDINTRVYTGQIDFDKIINLANFNNQYKELPKYPSMSRDIAIIVDEDILYGDIEKVIKKHARDLLEEIKLFDIYKGDQIPEGKKSLAFSIKYRSYERTLKEKEINKIQDLIISDLKTDLDGELRS
ncbi:MAG TPA: phenylalanine--tRNA ligase subunit beta [Tissierellaceae bacterium]|nr:phenylalanine--tRNA ligase subunit beta [Tissierellaceae bacterium]